MGLSKLLSVRLSDEDAVFLAGLRVDGAVTASDKVRALISQARVRAETPATLPGALAISHDILAEPLRLLREAEARADVHSDVVAGLYVALEEMLAVSMAAPTELADADLAALQRFEAKLVERAARLTEQLLRWAVTPSAPAYNSKVVSDRVAAITELMHLIIMAR